MNDLRFSSLSDSQNFGSHVVPEADALGLSNPDSMLAGQLRGTQNVGSGGAKIDASNNTITVTNSADGSTIGLGTIPGTTTGEFGFFSLDSTGKVVMKIVKGTKYVYDPKNSYVNVTQDGILPDGTGGFVAAKTGTNVADAFS
jgi:hypothetical protein